MTSALVRAACRRDARLNTRGCVEPPRTGAGERTVSGVVVCGG